MKKIIKSSKAKLLLISLIVIYCAVILSGCVPFKSAPDGLSSDTREFKKITDKRMDAVAPDYKGYIFKEGDDAFCFRLKSPTNEVDGQTYPMIVFLHGSGDWGSDNSRHMYKSLIDNVKKYVGDEVFVFMPQTIEKHGWTQDTENREGMSDLYNAALDTLLESKQIDKTRVYITGMSMGGHGSYYQAYNYSEKYAAVMPVCGYFPDDLFTDLTVMKDMPTWLGHSRTDDAVDFAESEKLYNRLVSAGATDIRNTWLDDYKHDMTEPFYNNAELWQWLMSKKKAS